MAISGIRFAICVFFAIALGCGSKPVTVDDYMTRLVTLPNGANIRAEVMVNSTDMSRGMMFRDSLAADRGMLFIHPSQGRHQYWMYQVRIPLDIIWMDSGQRIVEISANTPPCSGPSSECPGYGGRELSQYVLELAGGIAQKHGLKVGDRLTF